MRRTEIGKKAIAGVLCGLLVCGQGLGWDELCAGDICVQTLAPRSNIPRPDQKEGHLDMYLRGACLALQSGKPMPAIPFVLQGVLNISTPRQTRDAWHADATFDGRVIFVTFFKGQVDFEGLRVPALGIVLEKHRRILQDRAYWVREYAPRIRRNLLPYLEERGIADLFSALEQRQEAIPLPVGVAPDPVSLGIEAGKIIARAIRKDPDIVLGLATGSSPVIAYKELIRQFEEGMLDFSKVRTVNLDEYLGVGPTDSFSYRYFMNQQLFDYIRRGINDRKLRRWGLARVENEENDEARDVYSEHYQEDKAWQELRKTILENFEIQAFNLEGHAAPLSGEEIQSISALINGMLLDMQKTNRVIGPFITKNRYKLIRGIEKSLALHHRCLDIRNTHVLNGEAQDLALEVQAYEELLRRLKGVDLQILGIGVDGHIAFNEPAIRVGAEDLENLGDPQKGEQLADRLRKFNEFQLELHENILEAIDRLVKERRKAREGIGTWIQEKVRELYGKTLPGPVALEEAMAGQRFTIYLPPEVSEAAIEALHKEAQARYPEVVVASATDLLYSRTRVVDLAASTIIDNARFFDRLDIIPVKALTMGLGTIMDAKNILELAYGQRKGEPLGPAIEGPVSAENGASLLQRHPAARILIDEEADDGVDEYFVNQYGVVDKAEPRSARQNRSAKANYSTIREASKTQELVLYPRTERSLSADQDGIFRILIKIGAIPSGENLLSVRTLLILTRMEEALEKFRSFVASPQHKSQDPKDFTDWAIRLDQEDPDDSKREFVRFYPIFSAKGAVALGMNVLGLDGGILHWQLRSIPAEPTALERKGISWGEKGVEFNPVDAGQVEVTWTPIAQFKRQLPLPLELLRMARRDMQAFLKETVPKVEGAILGMAKHPITFREFQDRYPEAFPLLQRAFPEASNNLDQPIPLDWKANDLRSPPLLIHGVLQYIFQHRYMKPSDRILDFSGLPVRGERTVAQTQRQQGPLIVRTLLQPFMDAIRGAYFEARSSNPEVSLAELRFALSPVEAFGHFLKQGGVGRVVLPWTGESEEGYSLGDGVLIFDIDKTLLAKGAGLDDPDSAPIRETFISILRAGVKVRIISAGAAQKQYLRVLKPLEDLMARSSPEDLENLEMYAGTGTVRLYFDKVQGRFIKDEDHTLETFVPGTYARAGHMQDFIRMLSGELEGMLKEENSGQRLQGFVEEGTRVETLLREKELTGNLEIRQIDFGKPINEEGGDLFVEWRDGLSATLSGEIFRGGMLRQRLRDRLVSEAKRHNWPLEFTLGGETSIDITFQAVSKANVAQNILAREQFSSHQAVYFGDEFAPGGNDFPLTNPALEGITLVDVGVRVEPKRKAAFKVYPMHPDAIAELAELEERELMYVFSSLDGISYIAPGEIPKPGVAYTLSLFYRGQPIVVTTYFPHAETDREQWLVTSLADPVTRKTSTARAEPQAFLSGSRRDSSTDHDFTEALHSSLLEGGMSVGIQHPYGNAYHIRLLVREDGSLMLIRHGHVPKTKLGILGHAWLRGAVVMTMEGQNLFPLDMQRLSDSSPRYGSVLAFFEGPLPMGEDSLEQIVMEAVERHVTPVVGPLWEEQDAQRQAMELAA